MQHIHVKIHMIIIHQALAAACKQFKNVQTINEGSKAPATTAIPSWSYRSIPKREQNENLSKALEM